MELTGYVAGKDLTMNDIVEVAKRRSRLHVGHATRRKLGEDHDLVGLIGQWEFAKAFYLDMDLTDRPGGDGRVNFITEMGSVSVATYRKPYNLLRETKKKCADYHVLARFGEKGGWGNKVYSAVFLGWESDKEMLKCESRYFSYNVVSHYKRVKHLRPIVELRHILLGEGLQVSLL